jgi:hypothetical protein
MQPLALASAAFLLLLTAGCGGKASKYLVEGDHALHSTSTFRSSGNGITHNEPQLRGEQLVEG